MTAVSCAECVVDINVGIACESLGEFLLALFHGLLGCVITGVVLVDAHGFAFLFGIEAEVFEQENFAGLELLGSLLSFHAVGSELHVAAEGFGHGVADLKQGELGVDFSFWFAHVRHEDQRAAVVKNFLEGGEGTADACVVGDVSVLIEGHVEVYPHDGFLSFEIVIFDFSHFFIFGFCFL